MGAYLTRMRAAGRSPGTVNLHRHYLTQLRDVRRSPWSVTTEDMLELMAVKAWAAETRKSARTVWRGFYRWGHGVGLVAVDPALELPPVTVPAGVPRPTPEHLVRRLLKHPDERIGLMAMLAAYGGLRAGEIARVHPGRDLVEDLLLVHGKGAREREVPILEPYLLWRLQRIEGWAFPNGQGSHLSPGHVSRLLSREMPEGWTAHTLRHRCASQAYAGTRNLFAVSKLLGHSRVETTQRYTRLPAEDVRAAVAAASGL